MSGHDVDPDLLRAVAAATVHAGEQALIHNEAEVVGSVPGLMATLAPTEPYAYMLRPTVEPDGRVALSIQTTRQEVADIYTVVRGNSDVLSEEPIVELRAPWYAFWGPFPPSCNATRGPVDLPLDTCTRGAMAGETVRMTDGAHAVRSVPAICVRCGLAGHTASRCADYHRSPLEPRTIDLTARPERHVDIAPEATRAGAVGSRMSRWSLARRSRRRSSR